MTKRANRIAALCGCSAIVLAATSCAPDESRRMVATIGDEPIYADVVDKATELAVYEHLYDIYDIRRRATAELIGIRLIELSAKENGISPDSVIAAFRNRHGGREAEAEIVRSELIDSLAERYGAEICLKPPIAPAVEVDSAETRRRGQIGAKVAVTIISDYDCGLCQAMHKGLEGLFRKYGDRVEFRQIDFSDEASVQARAAHAADMQDAYWAMHDTLMCLHGEVTPAAILSIAATMGLDADQFTTDMADEEAATGIRRNSAYLCRQGILRTPTIMINNHPLRLTADIKDVEKEIERALNEKN